MAAQQRPVMSRSDLKRELELILVEGVRGGPQGPDLTMLRKASTSVDRIMALVDRYVTKS